jgi:hypothetical protein
MTEKEIWKYVLDKKVASRKILGKDHFWILKKDFEAVKNNFAREFNPFNPGRSLRSREYFLHIHAIEQGDYVFVHKDLGNVARFFPLGLIHLFVNVIPFFIYILIKRTSLKSAITCPLIKKNNL